MQEIEQVKFKVQEADQKNNHTLQMQFNAAEHIPPKQHKLRNVPMGELCKNHRKGSPLLNKVQEMEQAKGARGEHPNKTQ